MNRPRLSQAATRLLRAILDRAGNERGRILLSIFSSTDWQSLTFVGERHEFGFRISGPDAESIHQRLTFGLEDSEFAIPRHVLADVVVESPPIRQQDGSICFGVEALTIAE